MFPIFLKRQKQKHPATLVWFHLAWRITAERAFPGPRMPYKGIKASLLVPLPPKKNTKNPTLLEASLNIPLESLPSPQYTLWAGMELDSILMVHQVNPILKPAVNSKVHVTNPWKCSYNLYASLLIVGFQEAAGVPLQKTESWARWESGLIQQCFPDNRSLPNP